MQKIRGSSQIKISGIYPKAAFLEVVWTIINFKIRAISSVGRAPDS